MADIRRLYLDTAAAACDLVASPEVAAAWDDPSALAQFTVSGLAGHLLNTGTAVIVRYLDAEPPSGEQIDPATYYVTALTDDLDDDLHRGIRSRGEAAAEVGHEALVSQSRERVRSLESRLPAEPPTRLVGVFDGLTLVLDDYLVTRLLELVVHMDDLAVSVGIATPPVPVPVMDLVLGSLLDMGRLRHGDLAVLRALARRERDEVHALPVL